MFDIIPFVTKIYQNSTIFEKLLMPTLKMPTQTYQSKSPSHDLKIFISLILFGYCVSEMPISSLSAGTSGGFSKDVLGFMLLIRELLGLLVVGFQAVFVLRNFLNLLIRDCIIAP